MGLRLSAPAVATAVVVLTAPAAAAAGYERWHFVRTEGTTADTTFGEVTAPSHETAWAAGSRGGRPLLAGWNGARWRETPLPVPADTVLEGVAAASPRDAWVIGHTPDGIARVAQWTGRRWTAVPVAARAPSFPRAVDARSERDAWIVGSGGHARTAATTWHWDGREWRNVPVPVPSGVNSELVAVSARAGDDVWAAGSAGGAPLVTHWDGRRWTLATPPGSGALSDVVALADDDVWAVGTAAPSGDVPLVLHWSGREWQAMDVPEARGRLYAVASDGRGGVWVAGETSTGAALLAHWDGTGWSVRGAPTPANAGSGGATGHQHGTGAVWGLANAQDTPYLWAVGSYRPADARTPVQHVLTWTNAPPSR